MNIIFYIKSQVVLLMSLLLIVFMFVFSYNKTNYQSNINFTKQNVKVFSSQEMINMRLYIFMNKIRSQLQKLKKFNITRMNINGKFYEINFLVQRNDLMTIEGPQLDAQARKQLSAISVFMKRKGTKYQIDELESAINKILQKHQRANVIERKLLHSEQNQDLWWSIGFGVSGFLFISWFCYFYYKQIQKIRKKA